MVFAGDCCRYLCHTASGATVVLKQPSGSMVRRRHRGERADVLWPTGDTAIV
jgi:hypothetical protein